MRTFFLYCHTVRHLKLGQVIYRMIRPFRRFLAGRLVHAPGDCPVCGLEVKIPFLHHDPHNNAHDISSGYMSFLNKRVHVGCPVNWQVEGVSKLWLYNLHYMDYLHQCDSNLALEICRGWITSNPKGAEPGWNPYPCSLRIINWCKLGLDDCVITHSLFEQADWLSRNLEYEVLGNHLLENARALVFAGTYFGRRGKAGKWFDVGLELLARQLDEQVLPDGGHFERSPMYHNIVLLGCLDVLNILEPKHPCRASIEETCKKMMDFSFSILHPDNRMPLFNDAAQGIAPEPLCILEYGKQITGHDPIKRDRFPDTGYFILSRNDVHLIVDGGKIGPDYIPAHAHGDIFSYELSVGGERFVVDTGVYDYECSEERGYARSTAAHNTVAVDEKDQAEFWGAFRVGRRFAPGPVECRNEPDMGVFKAEYKGYRSLIGDNIVHHRAIQVDHRERRITVVDRITGRHMHTAVSRIHLDPGVALEACADGYMLRKNGVLTRLIIHDGAHHVCRTPYYPEFGKNIEKTTISVTHDGPLPCSLAYTIHCAWNDQT